MKELINYSFEFFPPRTEEGNVKLQSTIEALKAFDPEFFSVTFGAGGSTKEKTLETVLNIKKMGSTAVPHISCISSTRNEIQELLMRYKKNEIKNINIKIPTLKPIIVVACFATLFKSTLSTWPALSMVIEKFSIDLLDI